jgi:UDP-GlcNAc:undecaprenyl-phosphate GlcNAc-1-phosphate transferase
LIGLLGLADDAWALSPRVRLAGQVLAAATAVALGVRLEITGLGPVDAALALVWIVGITNAVNLLDNMDGLSAAIAGVAAAGCAAIGVAASLPVVALCGAAIAGATCGYLAYNIRPALIFMGDAGAVFLGFLLAVLVARASAATTTTGASTVVVAIGLLAIPLLDTATVTVSRVRRGIAVTQGGKDHLSHRLVARGLSPGLAVAALAVTNAATAGAALAVATAVVAPAVGLALVVAATVPVAWTTWRVPVAPHGSGLAAVARSGSARDPDRTAGAASRDGA